MKKCVSCFMRKPEEEFSFRIKKEGKRHGICKKCSSIKNNKHYRENLDRREKIKVNRRNQINKNKNFIYNFLFVHPCVDCGEKDIRTLDFDHVNGKKEFNISIMARRGYSIEHIIKEIEKCEVRCSNCHRKRHFKINEVVLA